MLSTLGGMEIDEREEQPLKAQPPMVVRQLFSPKVTEEREVQLAKVKSPKEVRLAGSSMDVSAWQPLKACPPMVTRRLPSSKVMD